MTQPLRAERATQKRVVQRFTRPEAAGGLGFRNLGDWSQRAGNRGVKTALLRDNLATRGYTAAQVGAALQKLKTANDSTGIRLYRANLLAHLAVAALWRSRADRRRPGAPDRAPDRLGEAAGQRLRAGRGSDVESGLPTSSRHRALPERPGHRRGRTQTQFGGSETARRRRRSSTSSRTSRATDAGNDRAG